MNVLVTGGTGTLGGYVIRELLRAGHTVSNYSRSAAPLTGVRMIQGDINDPEPLKEACVGQDAILHMAAVPGPGRQPPAQLLHVNVIGTVHVLEAAVGAGVPRFVLASSGAATGFSFQKRNLVPRYLPLDEDHPCEPQDEYGLSKLLAEITCKRYTDAYGIRTLCLRVNHNWYVDREGAACACGSGWARNLTVEDLWTQRYLKVLDDPEGEWPVPGPPAPHKLLWSCTDARDAAQAFRLAVEKETLRHEVFLINGRDTCSCEESARLIERHYPGVPLTRALQGFDTLWSCGKAMRLLGYQPKFTWRQSDFQAWRERLKSTS